MTRTTLRRMARAPLATLREIALTVLGLAGATVFVAALGAVF